jgi:nanoRNase/pAp phosphatase (c-di-AMP/oligoRNAs hydrolase)
MPNNSGKGALGALLDVVEQAGPFVILPHDNPDPDALASAATLQYIVKHRLGKDSVIALGGIVGRAENRAMLTYLNINLVPVGDIPFASDTVVALVDTQPGRTNNSLPEGFPPAVVIDHHPAYCDTHHVPFFDLRDEYGATSTILTEYLQESRLEVEPKIATALFYGIAAETQDLGREATQADIHASQFLYPHTNKRRLAKIENARVPREYFRGFRDAIESAVIYDDKAVITSIGEVRYPDMVAEVADFLLRLDQAEWTAAMGYYQGALYVSLRTVNRDVNAGELLQKVLGSHHAGGHDQIAGGRMPVPDGVAGWQAAAQHVRERLIAALGIEKNSATDLVA